MSERSTGNVTFLFSDVEGCAELSARYPAAVHSALALYEDILRRAAETHDGHVFRTDRDDLRAGFSSIESAVAAVLDAQRELRDTVWGETGPLPIRMALHSGPVWASAGDHVGITANRAARLLRMGHAGQVLVSLATWQQVHERLPAMRDLELRDLGEHGLGKLIPPKHVFQLVAPDLPADVIPLRPLEAFAHNLPVQLPSFVGRERTVDEIERLLATTRLLTFIGAGGIGKTRLALQVAGDMLGVFEDGVWLVELASLSDPSLVPLAVTSVFGVHEEPERLLLDTLSDHLRGKHLLLMLDYCEHLIEACAELVETLLYACPRLRILVTSREPLDVFAEVTWNVLSLSSPDLERLSFAGKDFVSALTEYEAVRLFDERARAAWPAFTLTARTALTVAQVCRRLDGIPLAIELVAANVRQSSVERIGEQLGDHFRLLTGGRHTAMPRDRTLHAVIGWAYGLLSEAEQMLLRRLSVFVGGWTVETAEIVCWGRGLETALIAGLLDQLADKSFVVVTQQNETTRYRMLETIRQYGRDELLNSGETGWVEGRFLDYHLRLAEEAETGMQGVGQSAWLERLEAEYDNFRAALEWGQASRTTAEAGLRLASALWRFWYLRGNLSEGRLWLEGALTRACVGTLARAKVFHAAGHLAFAQGEWIAARLFYEESLAIRRESGDKRGVVASLSSLGKVLKAQGEYGQAQRLYEESLAISRELGGEEGIAASLCELGSALLSRGNYQRAGNVFRESLSLWQEIGNTGHIVDCLVGLGRVAGAAGSWESAIKAARLLGAASLLLDTIGSPMQPSDRAEYDHDVAAVRAQLDEAVFVVAWAEGRAMTREQAITFALEV